MIKFIISGEELQNVVKTLKPATSVNRSNFKYMHCYIDNFTLHATTCDGYRVHSVAVPISHIENQSPELFLLPFPTIKFSHKTRFIDIERHGNTAIYNVFGTGIETLPIAENDTPIDMKKYLPDEEVVMSVRFNPEYIRKACEGLKGEDVVQFDFREGAAGCTIKSIMRVAQCMVLPVYSGRK